MKVLSVVGNRPQFIKSGPVSEALRAAGIDEVVLHTGQHWDRELSEVFFEELGLPEPAYRLDLHTADPDAMRPPIAEAPRARAAGLGARLRRHELDARGRRGGVATGAAVAHVEAGLRSGDLSMPEERNRIAVDRISQLLLPPDERSKATLEQEGVPGRIEVVGDVMADASLPASRRSRASARRSCRSSGSSRAATSSRPSIARRTSSRSGSRASSRGSAGSASRCSSPPIPRTRGRLGDVPPNVRVLEPLGYLDMAALASQARVIVTDSGGLQKEAYWYGVPCVTARPSTEWIDTVEVGANVLVDDDPERLAAAVASARMPVERPALYGDGNASARGRRGSPR